MDHSYEEIRRVVIDILAGREKTSYSPSQFAHLKIGVAEVFARLEGASQSPSMLHRDSQLSYNDRELFREAFWDLFRQGAITIGADDANQAFPWFCVSSYGKRVFEGTDPYYFYDAETYETVIKAAIPGIDETTLLYLKEAMQAYRSGCILSSSVMLGVATEHTFLLLMETIDANPTHSAMFATVSQQRTILQKVNKFKGILEQQIRSLPPDVREDLDTHFASILSVIRNYRNQSGHPSGKIISREQAYILLQLFIPYCKKLYQLRQYYAH